jgi:NAD(P)-dependent dehydrogenase (short-subunit alcohol dehydrogenase family)
MEIKGVNALVTGASSGIGRAIAIELVENGARVWGTSREPGNVEWPTGVQPLKLSLDRPDLVDEAWESQSMDLIGFDLIVNNAGYGVFGRYVDVPFEVWEKQIQALLAGTMKLCQLALPGLIERRGCLVNVSSIAADFPVPFMSAYNVSKAGLSAFTESVIIETSASGMKAIDFRPGDIKTGFNRNMVRNLGKNTNEGCMGKVWRRIEERVLKSPEPKMVATKLIKCIQRDKSGTIRAGTFFQATLAPLLSRLVTRSLARSGNIAYYTK